VTLPPLDAAVLPAGVRSRFVDGVNGLRMHVLEAGYADATERPCLLLLHGFPEIAYSWRRVMPALAEAGYHVVAPDLRGYGRTTGWDAAYDTDLRPFALPNVIRDMLGLVWALGRRHVDGVVGHDYGAIIAPWCALVRPDVFRTATIMSAPFSGPPPVPGGATGADLADAAIHEALAALPRPRKHYQWYYSQRPANDDMWRCPQGVHAFLRGYFHHKSADWADNRPFRLAAWTAEELAKMPTYYVMDLDRTMAETAAEVMPSSEAAACRWLTEDELAVYAGEYGRIGFQGGLNPYRCRTDDAFRSDLEIFAGRTLDVPSCFISGTSDWGVYQMPGAFEAMQTRACTRMLTCELVDGAGHWVQQEQPEAVVRLLLGFLEQADADA